MSIDTVDIMWTYLKIRAFVISDEARSTALTEFGHKLRFKVKDLKIIADLYLPDGKVIKEYIVYNLDKPFCSFLNTTVKPNLLSPNKMIVRRDEKGRVDAFFFLNF